MMNIRTIPVPKCPECYEDMVLRTRRSDDKKFWGCSTYPECKGTRNILPDGTPEEDDYESYADDEDDMSWHPGHPSNYGDR
jgi:ssDNA-binding Zn-finger/Zn-ribbon topoisomerase 1